jgi:hypothetical protein
MTMNKKRSSSFSSKGWTFFLIYLFSVLRRGERPEKGPIDGVVQSLFCLRDLGIGFLWGFLVFR